MELTLKDQSVIEIGQEIGNRVGEFQSAGTALVPANQMAPAGAVAEQVQPMNPFESMMTVLSDIRDGIYSLVDKFSEGVSLQDKALDQQEAAADAAALGATEENLEAPGDEPADDRSFLQKGKDKVSELMGAGGLKGLLIKGGLIFGLLGLATMLKKYGKQIAEAVAPIVDGLKKFFSAFSDDIGPLFTRAIDIIKTAFGGIIDIFKGIFTGDASTFFGGVKKIFIDFPIKLVSYIGDAFFSLIENALAAFGIESEMVTNIKEWFRKLPENISALFTAIGEFFTVTIPEKVIAIKDSIVAFFNDWIIDPFKNFFSMIGTFFSETIPNKVIEIKDGIVSKFTEIKDWIIDMATAPFRKVKELMTNLLVGILESVEGLPFIGKKAKALKESLLGKGTTEVADDIKQEGEQNVDMSNKMAENSGQKPNIQVDEDGNLLNPKDGAILKIPYAASGSEEYAKKMAGNVSAMGQGFFKPVYDDGGWFGMAHYRLQKIDGAGDGQDYSLSGPSIDPANTDSTISVDKNNSGNNLNVDSADFVSSEMGGGNTNVSTGGNVSSNTNNTVTQTYMAEETGIGDKSLSQNLTG